MKPRDLDHILRLTTGRARTVSSRTVQQMCRIVRPGETVDVACHARFRDRPGMIAITGDRILFCSAPMFGDVTVDEFALRGLQSVSYTLGFTRGDVCFRIAREEVVLERLPKRAVKAIVRALGPAGGDAKQRAGQADGDRPGDLAILDRVEQLHRLHRDGALTADEYHDLKSRLFQGAGAGGDAAARLERRA